MGCETKILLIEAKVTILVHNCTLYRREDERREEELKIRKNKFNSLMIAVQLK